MSDKTEKMTKDKITLYKKYSIVFLAILLVYILCTVVLPLMLHQHRLVMIEATAATCHETGNREYWLCTACEKVYEDPNAKVVTRKWKMNTKVLEHNFLEATCTAPSTCEFCECTEGKALGHDFEPTQYVWSEDMSECTATRSCLRDPSHVECETVQSVLTGNYYTVEFLNSAFGTTRVYNRGEGGYENTYEGEMLPTLLESPGNSFGLDVLGSINYPSSDTAQDFDITYIDGVKYRFVGMSGGTIRLYTEDDFENFIEIEHEGPHKYIDVSPEEVNDYCGKLLFTGYAGKLEWIECDMSVFTLEPIEYTSYSLKFDMGIVGKDATPCIDFENGILYWIGYTTYATDGSGDNKIIITAWDMSELDYNDPDMADVKYISTTTIDNLGYIQGKKCINEELYISVVNLSDPYEPRLLRIDPHTGKIRTKLIFDKMNVIEGVSYEIKDNEIKWYVSDYYNLYNIKIER